MLLWYVASFVGFLVDWHTNILFYNRSTAQAKIMAWLPTFRLLNGSFFFWGTGCDTYHLVLMTKSLKAWCLGLISVQSQGLQNLPGLSKGLSGLALSEDDAVNFVQHASHQVGHDRHDRHDRRDPADAGSAPDAPFEEPEPKWPELLPRPFHEALVVSIDSEKYKIAEADLKDQGVPAEMIRGFNGKNSNEVQDALALLTKYGNTAKLHSTVSNWMVCLHTSPGKLPDFSSAMAEWKNNLFRASPKNVSELLERDQHNCVPKIIAIAAAHVRLWEMLANGQLPKRTDLGNAGEDPWYLIMEEDVDLCPHWRRRIATELSLLPADADVVKLYFFGHWRKEDAAPPVNKSGKLEPSPFLLAQHPLQEFDILKAAMYEMLHGAGWKNVPVAGFYAGTQAYMLRPSGARKLLQSINGKPFQDVDMTMMLSVKNYVWRKVLAHARPENVNLLQLGSVPTCNADPPADQFW